MVSRPHGRRAHRGRSGTRGCRAQRKERRRYHLSLAEWDSRQQLHVPLTHPENVDGSDEAAEAGDFPLWLDELLADGIDAGEIVREEP